MILPIIGQECVVAYRGDLHIGKVCKASVNHLGQYRIAVYGAWGYAIDFKASAVDLIAVHYGNGHVYDQQRAAAEFVRKFSSAEQINMLNAEGNIPVALQHKPPPAPAPPAPRIVRDSVRPIVSRRPLRKP